jgi:uncharacterized protein YfeS
MFEEARFDIAFAYIAAGKGVELARRDDFIIALAFAQLLLDGEIDRSVKQRALIALRRQSVDSVLSFRGGGRKEARKRQLQEFHRVLEAG